MQGIFFPDSSWIPQYGWNSSFTSQEIVKLQNIYGFLKSKGHSATLAEKYAQMTVMKEKYPHLKYHMSDEKTLKQIFASAN